MLVPRVGTGIETDAMTTRTSFHTTKRSSMPSYTRSYITLLPWAGVQSPAAGEAAEAAWVWLLMRLGVEAAWAERESVVLAGEQEPQEARVVSRPVLLAPRLACLVASR